MYFRGESRCCKAVVHHCMDLINHVGDGKESCSEPLDLWGTCGVLKNLCVPWLPVLGMNYLFCILHVRGKELLYYT